LVSPTRAGQSKYKKKDSQNDENSFAAMPFFHSGVNQLREQRIATKFQGELLLLSHAPHHEKY
jgi:hypothetical protein